MLYLKMAYNTTRADPCSNVTLCSRPPNAYINDRSYS